MTASCPTRLMRAGRAAAGGCPCPSGTPKNWVSPMTVLWPTVMWNLLREWMEPAAGSLHWQAVTSQTQSWLAAA